MGIGSALLLIRWVRPSRTAAPAKVAEFGFPRVSDLSRLVFRSA